MLTIILMNAWVSFKTHQEAIFIYSALFSYKCKIDNNIIKFNIYIYFTLGLKIE